MAAEPVSDEVGVEIMERWTSLGFGPVLIEQWRGTLAGLSWDELPAEGLGELAARREELAERVTMHRVVSAAANVTEED